MTKNEFALPDDGAVAKDMLIQHSETSLLISPNLDALLEHEERTRQFPNATGSPTSFGHSSRDSFDGGTGLRPPPRGPKKTKSPPATPKDTEPTPENSPRLLGPSDFPESIAAAGLGPSPSNPYINSPPLFKPVFYNNSYRADINILPTQSTFEVPEKDSSNPPATPPSRRSSPSSALSPDYIHRSRTPDLQRPLSTYHHSILPKVEKKLLGRADGVLSVFPDVARSLKARTESDKRTTDSAEVSSQFFGLVRKRGKSPKPKDSSAMSLSSAEMRQKQDDRHIAKPPSLNLSRTNDSVSSTSQSARLPTRTLISHASHKSDSSAFSYSSDSTDQPASTDTEPRISISSTIYESSTYSHSIQSYLHRRPSLPTDMLAAGYPLNPTHLSPDRESFIDLMSPSSPVGQISAVSYQSVHDTSRNYEPPTIQQASEPSGLSPVPRKEAIPSPKLFDSARSKPPLPTAPKPNFKRSSSAQPPSSRKPSVHSVPQPNSPTRDMLEEALPPTTNFLNAHERAELVKKARKLAYMFGTTPAADTIIPAIDERRITSLLVSKHRHQRGVASMSNDSPSPAPSPLAEPTRGSLHVSTVHGRRHSSPLSPDQFSYISDFLASDVGRSPPREKTEQHALEVSDVSGHHVPNFGKPSSPTSFIDLSDEDLPNDDSSIITSSLETPKWRRILPYSPSTPSLMDNITPERQVEEERRRKRDKLARLHRFLGSRVPMDLVLGMTSPGTPLPLPAPVSEVTSSSGSGCEEDGDLRKLWLKRRRSSSAAAFPTSWSDSVDRLKEDLNDKEKALNVRRAIKMEKLFGVLPPQTLYHTRHLPSSYSFKLSPGGSLPPSPIMKNPNQSPYVKTKAKRNGRPGTSESNKQLLPNKGIESYDFDGDRRASVYMHYQNSLHSLNDIIDRDDRASLAELHQYLNSEALVPQLIRTNDRRASVATSIKSERRHSLPSRTSLISLDSECGIASLKPEPSSFQVRRKRAAKLTHFFGVDYRDLIQDVLESIEKGVEEERKGGALQPDEAEDLIQRVQSLRTKRNGIA